MYRAGEHAHRVVVREREHVRRVAGTPIWFAPNEEHTLRCCRTSDEPAKIARSVSELWSRPEELPPARVAMVARALLSCLLRLLTKDLQSCRICHSSLKAHLSEINR